MVSSGHGFAFHNIKYKKNICSHVNIKPASVDLYYNISYLCIGGLDHHHHIGHSEVMFTSQHHNHSHSRGRSAHAGLISASRAVLATEVDSLELQGGAEPGL